MPDQTAWERCHEDLACFVLLPGGPQYDKENAVRGFDRDCGAAERRAAGLGKSAWRDRI